MTAAQLTTSPVAEPSARKEAAGVLKRSSAFYVDPTTIVVDPDWNIRNIDMGDLDGLASSIKHELLRDPDSGGLLQDIGVRRITSKHPLSAEGKFNFVLVWGHRRHAAIMSLLKKGVPFPVGVPAKIVDKALDVQQATIQMFVENTQKPLLPLEEAAAYKRLRDGVADAEPPVPGMTLKEICAAVGRAMPHVTEMLALLEADDEVKDAVKSGKIGKQTAKVIASRAKGDKEAQKALVRKAIQAKGTKGGKGAVIREAENLKRGKNGKTPLLRALSDVQLTKLGAAQAAHVVTSLKNANKPADFDIRAWVNADDKLALAAAWGALEALKAAAGAKIDLEF